MKEIKKIAQKEDHSTHHKSLLDISYKKEELFIDFNINSCNDIFDEIDKHVYYFNYERPQTVLNYLTPIQFKNLNYVK